MLIQGSMESFHHRLPPCVKVEVIPAFEDNYLFLLLDNSSNAAAVVDPGDALPVLQLLQKDNRILTHILITHHHQDHIGGVKLLLECFPQAKVVCGSYEAQRKRIPWISHHWQDSETFDLWNLRVTLLEVPGHTLGHVAYLVEEGYPQQERLAPCLFAGDTLFGAGCGGVFEGTHQQMLSSLAKIRALPKNTLIYCAHEYTEKNLQVALLLKEKNQLQQERFEEVAAMRAAKLPTVPLLLSLEAETNPFLRWDCASLRLVLNTNSDLETFTAVRKFRDKF